MHPQAPRTHKNRLAEETSPYLLQHADNPVDWLPWGTEAHERARSENKPILLSVGYSACHWCHVMAHESFEDLTTARLMNDLFVNVKVDREERPDLDRIYQSAHQMLTQRGGGWPLTMFLSPHDHRPFFSGTYFPSEPRYGMPAFRDVLQRVAEFYRQNPDEVQSTGAALIEVFGQLLPPPDTDSNALSRTVLDSARATLQRDFDGRYGGFGDAPKFPHPMNIEFLMRRWRETAADDEPDLQALYMATLTLTRMAEGGIYDQLGGGFCRYSVDAQWMIPHFEKMLYDNGQLLAVSAQCAVATGDELFRRVTEETADWLRRDMEHPQGGYYSTLDADSEGHEGKFYVWHRDEIRRLAEPGEYEVLVRRFGLQNEPNFEGRWHLYCSEPMSSVATSLDLSETDAATRLASGRQRLLDFRNRRIHPARDEKILTAWNGLAIYGMAAASRALSRPDYAASASRAVAFLREHCWQDERLLAVFSNGQARFSAYLDDHAFLAWGLLELLQTRWHGRWLSWIVDLCETMLTHFADTPNGGFFFTADDSESLIQRPKIFGDDATPSGNGIAARVMIRLGYLLGETRYIDAAEGTLRAARPVMEKYPQAHTSLLMALDELTLPPTTVVLRGPTDQLESWRGELDKLYDPRRLLFAVPEDAEGLPNALTEKKARPGQCVAYVCTGMTCSAPITTLSALVAQLRD